MSVKSTKHSSIEKTCTLSVNSSKMPCMESEVSIYFSRFPTTGMTCGHARFASGIVNPVFIPYARASYDAVVTMVRPSPHTTTGLPRRRGLHACSTDAKNAFMSISIIFFRAWYVPSENIRHLAVEPHGFTAVAP